MMPPINIVNTTENPTRIPMPTPVGDGTHFLSFGFASSTVNSTPRIEKIASAHSADVGKLLAPSLRIVAKPAHLREIGERSSALTSSPAGPVLSTMPYVL